LAGFTETVEMRGHIIDSQLLSSVLNELADTGVEYVMEIFEIGRTVDDTSYAKIKLHSDDEQTLERVLARIHDFGANPTDIGQAELKEVDIDGAFPADFYSTTNLPTEVRVGGHWLEVQSPEMDCGVLVEGNSARTIPVSDVRKGQLVVTGRSGVRVTPLNVARGGQTFEFMASSVSSEKPKDLQIRRIADEMRRVRDAGQKILWVVGPALIHTGSGPDLGALVRNGWVSVLFGGNGFATHDIESNIFETSLGVYLSEGIPAEGGHEHHIRAINLVRRSGSIAAAVSDGTITGGVMYDLVQAGVPFVLGGSVRDDGPLPDTVTDILETQTKMRQHIGDVGLTIVVASMLHGIATGNILPATVPLVCVDINPSTVTKLMDRGSIQSSGLVTDVGLFVRQLKDQLVS